MKRLRFLLSAWILAFVAPQAGALVINEIRTDHTGTDTDEYFELAGTPNQALTGLSYIVIGDGTGGSGVIESVTNLGGMVLQADGYLALRNSATVTPACAGYDGAVPLTFENNDNVTHMLVSGFTGTNGQDLDTNNDGVLDVTPWTSIVDCVAIIGVDFPPTPGAEYVYCSNTVGPNGNFHPGHVLRCPDTTGGWAIGSFSNLCTYDTPGAANNCSNLPPLITTVLYSPCAPAAAQQVTVRATITDFNNNVTTVRVFHRLVPAVPFDSVTAASVDPTTWQAVLPGRPDQSRVQYYVGAYDGTGNFVRSPNSAPTGFVYDYRVGIQTIASIQASPLPDSCGTSTLDAQAVNVVGVVTHRAAEFSDDSFYIQSGNGPNSGIRVFAPGAVFLPELGDSVRVSGFVDEFRCQTEISMASDRFIGCGAVLGRNRRVRARPLLSVGDLDLEENESVLVTVQGPISVVTAFDSTNFGKEFKVATGADSAYVGDDTFFPDGVGYTIVPAPGMVLDGITGIVAYRPKPTVPPREHPDIILRLEPRRDNDVDRDWTDVPEAGEIEVVRAFDLGQNRPNPFNPVTTIEFAVPAPGPTRLTIFDARGGVVRRLLERTYTRPGRDRVAWDGRDERGNVVSSGLYLYRLEFADRSATRKMLLLK